MVIFLSQSFWIWIATITTDWMKRSSVSFEACMYWVRLWTHAHTHTRTQSPIFCSLRSHTMVNTLDMCQRSALFTQTYTHKYAYELNNQVVLHRVVKTCQKKRRNYSTQSTVIHLFVTRIYLSSTINWNLIVSSRISVEFFDRSVDVLSMTLNHFLGHLFLYCVFMHCDPCHNQRRKRFMWRVRERTEQKNRDICYYFAFI